ncbi:aminotransferase A [Anaerobacillus isosaccharinicus]|uniref:Aminotransferase n=1 Tax=Anaerobacillus isosaccharinicus TaxID=1532552 RepID=A0A7S7L793_9BACI|nr:aminotransferase A [Anaerobacillus isosaccharinicus]MBA5586023.1 aminotransferase A [Anaerobacillus isosaccharinicus]QOY35700.1 aminotransferase A [Anaerobacillus isosaccharinicus]
MEHLINTQVKNIQISGIRQFFNRVAQFPDAIQLTIGQPDFPTPEHIKEAGKKAIAENKTGYTKNAGLDELCLAATNFIEFKYKLTYNPKTEVITTIGASQGIDIAFRTILEEGSEVILPGPVYPAYEPIIKMCGGIPVYADTRETGFKITAKQIESLITSKTRCVMLPYPSNPTGCILTKTELAEIAQVLQDRNVFVLSDEIYSELVYGQKHYSIASFPGMKEKTIIINGLSKSHSMTGWRVGFVFAPENIAKHMLKVHQYNVSCASSISQWAAVQALTKGVDDASAMRGEYEKRRDYVYDRLVSMGIEVVKPEGAFYLFPSIAKFGLNAEEFAIRLLEEGKVACVPGSAFSGYGEGYLRLSYAYSMEILEEGCNRFERFIATL